MNTTNLTSGNIRSQFIALAAPLLMGNILQQLYNTIDAVIVGQYVGQNAFAAVGVAGSVMNLFLFLLNGGCAGVGVMLSQFYGADDLPTFRRGFFLSTVAGGAFTVLLTTAALLSLYPLLHLMRTPPEVIPYAADYLRIIYLGFLSAFAFHLSSAVLRCVGDTRSALIFLLISMAVNLILDIWFIAGLEFGVAGAALATVIAQGLAALLCVGYLVMHYPRLVFRRKDVFFDPPLLLRTARFSLVSAMQMCSLYVGKLLVQGTVNALGTDAIAAYTAATRIEGFANSFGDSGSSAMSVFIGQNTGAKNYDRVKQGFGTGEKLLAALGLFMSLLMILFAVPTLKLVLPADSAGGMAHAVGYLRLVACFYLFNFLGSGLSGYFHGRGRVNLPVMGTTLHISMRVILSFFLAPKMGLEAVALATGIGWVCVVSFRTVFRKGDFRRLDA